MYVLPLFFVSFLIFTVLLPLAPVKLITPFWRTYEDEDDHYSLIVHTIPIFASVPDPKNVPIPKMSRHDVGSQFRYHLLL
jgi:hypothetical protein